MEGIRKIPCQQIEIDEDKIIDDIARNIHNVRVAKKISVRLLALKAGVQERHLYKIENGRHRVGILTVIRIARALDLDINSLINGTGLEEYENKKMKDI